MLSTNSFKILLAAGAMALVAGGANAATCNVTYEAGNSGGFKTVSYTVTQGVPDAIVGLPDCREGNDKNTLPGEGWILGDATDAPSNGLVLTITGQEWSISNPLGYTDIMLVVKQAASFAGFMLDTTKPLSGLWATVGPEDDSRNVYSHISVWRTSSVAPIPVPAAGFLMIGALGGLAALRRRRRAV